MRVSNENVSDGLYIAEIRLEKTTLRNSRNRKQNACVNAGKKGAKYARQQ